jgi:hypothetical protein
MEVGCIYFQVFAKQKPEADKWQGCTSRKAASYNQFPCNTAPQGLMPQSLEFCEAKLRKTKPLPTWRPAVLIARFLRSKNRKLKNGRDAIFEQRKG